MSQIANAMNSLPRQSTQGRGSLIVDPGAMAKNFDKEPFALAHNLHQLDMFKFESLQALAERFDAHPEDYFVTGSAPTAGTEFFSVPHGSLSPGQAIWGLDQAATRILLKRPENHDQRFRDLLDELFLQVVDLKGGLGDDRVVRLESAIFITSASSMTPFHFDPEIAFFSQIEGEKIYHVYSPQSLTEMELERFYLQGVVNIGQVDLDGRDPATEWVFKLGPGKGHHQPQNSPHWVATGLGRSVSYSFVFETKASRAAGRARACNHYLRKFGITPNRVGAHPARDTLKSESMRLVIPLRSRVGSMVRKFRRG
jgi:hypothetical protein